MDEHFDVGVSLTLDDAVAEELQRAQSRIETLERAANVGGVSPRTLSEIARPVQLEQAPANHERRKAETALLPDGLSTAASLTGTVAGATVVDASAEASGQRAAPKSAEVNADRRRPIVTILEPSSSRRAPFMSPDLAPARPRSASIDLPEKPLASVAPPGDDADAVPSGYTTVQSATAVQLKPIALPMTGSAPASQWAGGTQKASRREAETDLSGTWVANALSTGTLLEGSTDRTAANGLSPGSEAASSTRSFAAPKLLRGSGISGRLSPSQEVGSEQTASGAAQPTDAPHDQSGANTSGSGSALPGERLSISGDVYLDGAIVGRWMSKLLGRDAERASAGPTGFDARRGRLLPGPTVG